jgi:hypothetical protein
VLLGVASNPESTVRLAKRGITGMAFRKAKDRNREEKKLGRHALNEPHDIGSTRST